MRKNPGEKHLGIIATLRGKGLAGGFSERKVRDRDL